jgi:two-component system sensor kinase FixL
MTRETVCDSATSSPEVTAIPLAEVARRLSHKIRNPLSVIFTAASQIEESTETIFGGDDQAMIQTIMTAAEQIENILRRFSLFACPEPIEPVAVDINELCRLEIENCIADMADSSGVGLVFHPVEGITAVNGDRHQIRIVLSELIANALRASGPERTIIRTGIKENMVEVTIENQGPDGLFRNADEIFWPFYSTRPGGAGLGLAIANSLIAAHGGHLVPEHLPGGGNRVTISLPRNYDEGVIA